MSSPNIPPSLPPHSSNSKQPEEQRKLGPSQTPSPTPEKPQEMTRQAAIEAALMTWCNEPNLNAGEIADRKKTVEQIRKCPLEGKILLFDLPYLSSLPMKALELLKIQSLSIVNCEGLESLSISKKFQSLQKLQIVKCKTLHTLSIEGEHTNLSEVKIDACQKLTSLSIGEGSNRLTQVVLKGAKLNAIPKTLAKLPSSCTIYTQNCCKEYQEIETFRKRIEKRQNKGETVPQWKDESSPPPPPPPNLDPYRSQG